MTSLNLDYFFNKIYQFFQLIFGANFDSFAKVFYFALSIIAIFFLVVLAYCGVRLLEIRKREHEHLHHEIVEYAKKQEELQRKEAKKNGSSFNKQWGVVLEYLFSNNPNDWKLAIMEAENILEGLMEYLGVKGENLGEKLKNADKANFRGISDAWEAHLIRNRIAHEGVNFELSLHEAKRVIALYEKVFREYGYI